MSLHIYALVDQKLVSFYVGNEPVNKLGMYAHILETPDVIYQISISKDYLIVTTEAPDVQSGLSEKQHFKGDRSVNNINAYDWMGNHMWNIGEIVGDIKVPFDGGNVSTKDLIAGLPDIDASKLDETHELFVCTANSHMYIIDLTEKKLLQRVQTK